MNGMMGEVFSSIVAALPSFQAMARSAAEVPVQSIVEDKTQWQSESYADVTDDLHPILHINDAERTGFESIEDEALRAIKYILNGQLLIQKGEHTYTPQGQRITQ